MGWTGYFSLYDGTPALDPGCGGDFPDTKYQGNNQIVVPAATCNCTCKSATGQQCELSGQPDTNHPGSIDGLFTLDVPCGGSPTCAGSIPEPATWNGTCDATNGLPGGQSTCGATGNCITGTAPCNRSVVANQLQLTGGSCTADMQPPTLPPVSWSEDGHACGDATPGTGCTGGEVCMPIPKAPFHTGICVMHAGNVPCPAGQFTDPHVFYDPQQLMDARTCSTCTCGSPAGGACSAVITVSTSTASACTGSGVTLMPTTQGGDCANLTGNPAIGGRKATFSITTPGTCTPTSMPSGTVTATAPTTFCCIP